MSKPMRPDQAVSPEGLLGKVREKQLAQETLAHDRFTFGPTSPRITPTLEHVGRIERDLCNLAGARDRCEQVLHPATVRRRHELERIEREARHETSGPA